jgi:flavin-dependent dehydrogenase
VVAAGTPAIRRTLFRYADSDRCDRVVQVSIRPSVGVDALYAPRRHILDRILVDAAADAGVHVLHETTVTGLLRGRDGRVAGVRAIGRSGRRVELPSTLVIGADGIRSQVAAEVGAPVIRRGQESSAVRYRYFADLPADGYEWAYGRGAAAGLLPTNDGLVCAFVATTPTRMRRARQEAGDALLDVLAERCAPGFTPRLREARPASRTHGWAGVPGFVRQSWGPGWALVGDAGYFKDPITTHGMTDALRDAELLSDAVLAGLAGDGDAALAEYQATRDGLSTKLFEATERVAAYDWDSHGVEDLLRQVSSAMSDEVDLLAARTSVDAIPAALTGARSRR